MPEGAEGSCSYGNTAQFPPNGLSTAPADLRAKSRRKASVALRSASLRLGVRHGISVAKMLDNVGLRYPHRTSGAKAPRTLRPLPLLRFAVSATGGAHLCSTKYYLRFWLSRCRTSLAVSALRIMRYCLYENQESESSFSTAVKASLGRVTLPSWRIFFLPSFCFSSSFFLRVMSPP